MHTIMVPLDGSPTAEMVLPHVVPLAMRRGARLTLVAVHEPGVPARGATGVPAVDRRIDDEARGVMGDYLAGVARGLAADGLVVDTVVLQGVPAERIAWYAETTDVDLLALASHGRGGFTRLWLGSVTDRVLRHVDTPMLVVHAEEGVAGTIRRPIQRVLVPVDGTVEAEAICAPLGALFAGEPVAYTLVRIATEMPALLRATASAADVARDAGLQRTEASAYLERAAERFGARLGTVGTLVRTARDPAREILATAAETGADLIALTTHGAGVVGRTLMGSVADKVMRGSPVPVLLKRVAHTRLPLGADDDRSVDARIAAGTVQQW